LFFIEGGKFLMARNSFEGAEKTRHRHHRKHHSHDNQVPSLLGMGLKRWSLVLLISALFAVLLYLAWRG